MKRKQVFSSFNLHFNFKFIIPFIFHIYSNILLHSHSPYFLLLSPSRIPPPNFFSFSILLTKVRPVKIDILLLSACLPYVHRYLHLKYSFQNPHFYSPPLSSTHSFLHQSMLHLFAESQCSATFPTPGLPAKHRWSLAAVLPVFPMFAAKLRNQVVPN